MRRAAAAILLAFTLAVTLLAAGSGGDEARRYTVEFDTGFGLVKDGDLKVAGVRAGVIEDLRLDRDTYRALADIRIDRRGFGTLRTDAHCEIRPQSLLGEYFVDCDPGTAAAELPEGAVIGVEHTSSTVAPDLVTNLMRRPVRERLRLIIGELGAAAAGNGRALNDALGRAVPAIRETDRVLAALAEEERALGTLIEDADTVLAELAGNRSDVGRWITETRDLTAASADRSEDLRLALRRTPGFLAELSPAMTALGDAASAARPAVERLGNNADGIQRLLAAVPPLAGAARPAVAATGKASVTGRAAVRTAAASVAELGRFTKGAPELLRNVAIILEQLDDRDKAVTRDPRSPGGQGFTGMESLLAYVFYQTLALNTYDAETHLLKGALFENDCLEYRNAEQVKGNQALIDKCATWLGPNQPGVTTPDLSDPGKVRRATARPTPRRSAPRVEALGAPPQAPPAVEPPAERPPDPLTELLPQLDLPPELDLPPVRELPDEVTESLLDYLLGA